MIQNRPIISTKIHVPSSRSDIVPRRRLIEQLNSGIRKRVTLISAPAGYGKTTLLSDWVQQNPNQSICWLSLDTAENDPVPFFQYLIASLQSVDLELGKSFDSSLQSFNPPGIEDLLIPLLNQLSEFSTSLILVLDDYHLITDKRIHHFVIQMVEYSPANIHYIFSTRADPPFPLDKWRARNQLSELRQSHLSFTQQEAYAFLSSIVGGTFSPNELILLSKNVEGWAAGLQFVGLSLIQSGNKPKNIKAVIQNQSYFVDYLGNEIIDQLPVELRTFVLKTSILDRLCGPLCDQITGMSNSEAVLKELYRMNLFINKLDGNWFRFHPLFSSVALERLVRDLKETSPILHQTASDWYAQNGYVSEAIDHALSSGDISHSSALIVRFALDQWNQGAHITMLRQIHSLPQDIILESAALSLWFSILLFFVDKRPDLAMDFLRNAERKLEQYSPSGEDVQLLTGILAVYRSYLAFYKQDIDSIILNSEQALKMLPEKQSLLRDFAQLALMDACFWKEGNTIKAEKEILYLINKDRIRENPYLHFSIAYRYALILLYSGKLHQGYSFCEEIIERLSTIKPRLSKQEAAFHVAISEVLVEWNRLEEARHHLDIALEIYHPADQPEVIDAVIIHSIRGFIACGDTPKAREIIQWAKTKIPPVQLTRPYLSLLTAWQVRLDVEAGNLEQAERLLTRYPFVSESELHFLDEPVYIAQARLWNAQKKYAHVGEFLDRLGAHLLEGDRIGRMIEILVLRSISEVEQGHPELAQQLLSRAISLGSSEGFLRVFLEGGHTIHRLAIKLAAKTAENSTMLSILAVFNQEKTNENGKTRETGLFEMLSDREKEILQLLSSRAMKKEIAVELGLSVNTVNYHTKNIYQKLGAHNRAEAVQIARKQGLL